MSDRPTPAVPVLRYRPRATPDAAAPAPGAPLVDGLDLEALALAWPDDAKALAHPNRTPFEGVLTRLDEPSTRPPHGTRDPSGAPHCVLIPRGVAAAALPSLIGMGVGVASTLRDHNPRQKIGVIDDAWIEGQDLKVRGYLYARDFAQEVAQIRAVSRTGSLGMSFEVTGVEVEDPRAPVWTLRALTFTGAAILTRASAAYERTQLLAASTDGAAPGQFRAPDGGADQRDAPRSRPPDNEETTMTVSALQQLTDDIAGLRQQIEASSVLSPPAADQTAATPEEGAVPVAPPAATLEATALAQLQSEFAEVKASVGLLLKAQNELLTDVVKPLMSKLLTDAPAPVGNAPLLTDQRLGPATNGGPVRKTLSASGDYPVFLSKYGFDANGQYTQEQIDAALQAVTDTTQRLAVKHALLAHNQVR